MIPPFACVSAISLGLRTVTGAPIVVERDVLIPAHPPEGARTVAEAPVKLREGQIGKHRVRPVIAPFVVHPQGASSCHEGGVILTTERGERSHSSWTGSESTRPAAASSSGESTSSLSARTAA